MKTLYWIDDSHDKQKLPSGAVKRQLEAGLGVVLKPDAPINDRVELAELVSGMDPKTTRGVIMDYQLTEIGEKGQMAYGTTWAAEIRAKHPSIPVIGISHCLESDIPKFQLENFLAFFPRKYLTCPTPKIDDLNALLNGHDDACRVLAKQGKQPGVELIMKLLASPTEIADLLRSAIPLAFRGKWDKETPHAAGRWIWHDFQGRPGFLFDELGLATHLGLNVKGLEKVSAKFKSARYGGSFASDGRPRWWVGLIRKLYEKTVGRKIVGPVSSARDDLLMAVGIKTGEKASLLSHPHGRIKTKEIPDCVAYRDDQREEEDRVQVLIEDTYVDDADANPAFGFEARRIYLPRKH